jgi:hypothetical protein
MPLQVQNVISGVLNSNYESITRALRASHTLRHLTLSGEAMGDSDFVGKTLCDIVTHLPLESLYLCFPDDERTLDHLFRQGAGGTKLLRHLAESRTLMGLTLINFTPDDADISQQLANVIVGARNLRQFISHARSFEKIDDEFLLPPDCLKIICDAMQSNKNFAHLCLGTVKIDPKDQEAILLPAIKQSSLVSMRLGGRFSLNSIDERVRYFLSRRYKKSIAWMSVCFIISFLRANYHHIYRDSGCPLDTIILELLGMKVKTIQSHRAKIVKTKFAENVAMNDKSLQKTNKRKKEPWS